MPPIPIPITTSNLGTGTARHCTQLHKLSPLFSSFAIQTPNTKNRIQNYTTKSRLQSKSSLPFAFVPCSNESSIRSSLSSRSGHVSHIHHHNHHHHHRNNRQWEWSKRRRNNGLQKSKPNRISAGRLHTMESASSSPNTPLPPSLLPSFAIPPRPPVTTMTDGFIIPPRYPGSTLLPYFTPPLPPQLIPFQPPSISFQEPNLHFQSQSSTHTTPQSHATTNNNNNLKRVKSLYKHLRHRLYQQTPPPFAETWALYLSFRNAIFTESAITLPDSFCKPTDFAKILFTLEQLIESGQIKRGHRALEKLFEEWEAITGLDVSLSSGSAFRCLNILERASSEMAADEIHAFTKIFHRIMNQVHNNEWDLKTSQKLVESFFRVLLGYSETAVLINSREGLSALDSDMGIRRYDIARQLFDSILGSSSTTLVPFISNKTFRYMIHAALFTMNDSSVATKYYKRLLERDGGVSVSRASSSSTIGSGKARYQLRQDLGKTYEIFLSHSIHNKDFVKATSYWYHYHSLHVGISAACFAMLVQLCLIMLDRLGGAAPVAAAAVAESISQASPASSSSSSPSSLFGGSGFGFSGASDGMGSSSSSSAHQAGLLMAQLGLTASNANNHEKNPSSEEWRNMLFSVVEEQLLSLDKIKKRHEQTKSAKSSLSPRKLLTITDTELMTWLSLLRVLVQPSSSHNSAQSKDHYNLGKKVYWRLRNGIFPQKWLDLTPSQQTQFLPAFGGLGVRVFGDARFAEWCCSTVTERDSVKELQNGLMRHYVRKDSVDGVGYLLRKTKDTKQLMTALVDVFSKRVGMMRQNTDIDDHAFKTFISSERAKVEQYFTMIMNQGEKFMNGHVTAGFVRLYCLFDSHVSGSSSSSWDLLKVFVMKALDSKEFLNFFALNQVFARVENEDIMVLNKRALSGVLRTLVHEQNADSIMYLWQIVDRVALSPSTEKQSIKKSQKQRKIAKMSFQVDFSLYKGFLWAFHELKMRESFIHVWKLLGQYVGRNAFVGAEMLEMKKLVMFYFTKVMDFAESPADVQSFLLKQGLRNTQTWPNMNIDEKMFGVMMHGLDRFVVHRGDRYFDNGMKRDMLKIADAIKTEATQNGKVMIDEAFWTSYAKMRSFGVSPLDTSTFEIILSDIPIADQRLMRTFTSLISFLFSLQRLQDAFFVWTYLRQNRPDIKPDNMFFTSFFKSMSKSAPVLYSSEWSSRVNDVIQWMHSSIRQPDLRTWTTLLSLYAKQNNAAGVMNIIQTNLEVFSTSDVLKDSVTTTTIILALLKIRKLDECFLWLRDLTNKNGGVEFGVLVSVVRGLLIRNCSLNSTNVHDLVLEVMEMGHWDSRVIMAALQSYSSLGDYESAFNLFSKSLAMDTLTHEKQWIVNGVDALVNCCRSDNQFARIKALVQELGLENDQFVESVLIKYVLTSRQAFAKLILENDRQGAATCDFLSLLETKLLGRHVVFFNTVLEAYLNHYQPSVDTINAIHQVASKKWKLTSHYFANICNYLAKRGFVSQVEQFIQLYTSQNGSVAEEWAFSCLAEANGRAENIDALLVLWDFIQSPKFPLRRESMSALLNVLMDQFGRLGRMDIVEHVWTMLWNSSVLNANHVCSYVEALKRNGRKDEVVTLLNVDGDVTRRFGQDILGDPKLVRTMEN